MGTRRARDVLLSRHAFTHVGHGGSRWSPAPRRLWCGRLRDVGADTALRPDERGVHLRGRFDQTWGSTGASPTWGRRTRMGAHASSSTPRASRTGPLRAVTHPTSPPPASAPWVKPPSTHKGSKDPTSPRASRSRTGSSSRPSHRPRSAAVLQGIAQLGGDLFECILLRVENGPESTRATMFLLGPR